MVLGLVLPRGRVVAHRAGAGAGGAADAAARRPAPTASSRTPRSGRRRRAGGGRRCTRPRACSATPATASIQTPLLAVAWERAAAGDPAFAAEGLEPLAAHARWLCRERDPDGDGLITILLPDESGLDDSPKYDQVYGEARALAAGLRAARAALPAGALERARVHARATDEHVEDVLVNVAHALSLRALGRMSGEPEWAARAARVEAALMERCWDPRRGLFFDLAGRGERRVEVSTWSSLAPLALGDAIPREVRERVAERAPAQPAALRRALRRAVGVDGGAVVPAGLQRVPHLARGGVGVHGVAADRRAARAGRRRRGRPARRRACSTPSSAPGCASTTTRAPGAGHGEHGFGMSALVLDLPAGLLARRPGDNPRDLPRHRSRPAVRRPAPRPRDRVRGLLLALHRRRLEHRGDRRRVPRRARRVGDGDAVRGARRIRAHGGRAGGAGGRARARRRRADLLRATPDSLDVALDGATLQRALRAPARDWPRRAFGALGPAQVVPGLGQYWTPHLLSASVSGHAALGDRELSLDGARVYAEKNWGTAFASHWWWGQASLDDGAGVAFAGGRVHGVAPTAVVAWTPDGLVSLAPPFARTVARASGGEWHIRARSPRHAIEIRGEATGPPLRLPVPIPGRAPARDPLRAPPRGPAGGHRPPRAPAAVARRIRPRGTGGWATVTPRVVQLWRYPVKSMAGEPLEQADVYWHGIRGDRRYALVQPELTHSDFPWLTIRERAELVGYRPRLLTPERPDASRVAVRTPGGEELDMDELASRFQAHAIKLNRGAFDSAPVSLISLGTVGALDARRFRMNVVIDTPEAFAEDELDRQHAAHRRRAHPRRPSRLALRDHHHRSRHRRARPVDPQGATVARNNACAGVYCSVVEPGRLTVGDEVIVEGRA